MLKYREKHMFQDLQNFNTQNSYVKDIYGINHKIELGYNGKGEIVLEEILIWSISMRTKKMHLLENFSEGTLSVSVSVSLSLYLWLDVFLWSMELIESSYHQEKRGKLDLELSWHYGKSHEDIQLNQVLHQRTELLSQAKLENCINFE